MPEPTIYALAREFREELLRQEREAATVMIQYYGEMWGRIRQRLDALMGLLAEAKAQGETVNLAWLWEANRLSSLRRQVEAEMMEFSRWAGEQVLDCQQEAVQLAMRFGREIGLGLRWDQLPTGPLRDLVGFTRPGSPLKRLLDALGADAGRSVEQELIAGVGLGSNPAEIARRIRGALGGDLVRALRIARTETMRAYREATHREYDLSGQVEGWQWVCAKGQRTCAACLAMDGTVHPLGERLDDHPNGRCAAIPVLKGAAPAEYQTGEEWFAMQGEERQRLMLGDALYGPFKDGLVTLRDLVEFRENPDWGRSIGVKSLKGLGL